MPVGAKAERAVVPAANGLTDVGARLVQLRAENEALSAEVERLENQVVGHESYVLDGYIVAVYPVGDGTHIATCPTLHASVQEPSPSQALQSLREAVSVVKAAHERSGRSLPPRDVVARCLY
jgi:hypothetical protein